MEKLDLFGNALEGFKKLIGVDFIVGGSLALYMQGFDCEIHDIDLELRAATPETLEKLRLLNSSYADNADSCHYPELENHFRFKLLGTVFDVWVVEEFDYNRFVCKNRVRYADVISVFRKKIAMKRPKDYEGLIKYAQQILNLISEKNEVE